MRATDQFHVGIVVDELDASLQRLTALFGYTWTDEVAVEHEVRTPAGATTVPIRFRYSRDQPRLEVIQAQPGTVWTPVAGSGLHHLGYWSDDVAADGIELEASGYVLEARSADVRGGPLWSYHRHPNGERIELVYRDLRDGLAMLWS